MSGFPKISNYSFSTCCFSIAQSVNLHVEEISPAMLWALLEAFCEEDEVGGVCVEQRAALRVRPPAGVSAFPLTI